jgi:hypothetical protein
MYRLSAILLSAFFSFSLISPAVFAADPDASLPACCRRDGKHHCAVPADGPTWKALPNCGTGCQQLSKFVPPGPLSTPAAVQVQEELPQVAAATAATDSNQTGSSYSAWRYQRPPPLA